jgi:hypothetical protein
MIILIIIIITDVDSGLSSLNHMDSISDVSELHYATIFVVEFVM